MPGTVTLFGSGETSTTGGRVFEALAAQIMPPLQVSILETPAGFEVNAERVAGRIRDFLANRLQNYHPHLRQIAARKKGTPNSPDSVKVAAPLYESSMIFLGPGSPSYTVRQLQNSLTWHILQARHRLGASIVFASAAAIAAGSPALPVYEIFKVGEDPHWKFGLDFFLPFGLALVIIPHWNNQDGGSELDTSRCFIGRERFEQLLPELPAEKTVLGIDEMTAVTLDFESRTCRVEGMGGVHLLRGGQQDYLAGYEFPLDALGAYQPLADPGAGLPVEVWEHARQIAQRERVELPPLEIPAELEQMVADREAARMQRDWPRADHLRQEIATLGWNVIDSPDGPQVKPINPFR